MRGQKRIGLELKIENGELRIIPAFSGVSAKQTGCAEEMRFFKILIILVTLVIQVQLFSCASSRYFAEGKQSALPDSAKVKTALFVSQEDTKEKLSAVLFAVPNKRYRFEFSGTFGLGAASILWKKDEGWRIVLPQNERYMEGTGDCVFVPIYGGVDIHKFAALFFGQRVNSLACEGYALQHLTLEYVDNTALAFSGTDSLKLEIKNIDSKAKWKSGVWNLNVPDKYVRVDVQ